jgi:ABC-type transport system involved in multi-copper enzyme maturation permease subunit
VSWLTIAGWEFFKVRGRRVIWILLGILVGFSSLMVVIRYADYEFQKNRDVVDEIIFLPDAPIPGTFEVELNCTEFLAGVPITEVPAPYTLDDIDLPGTDRKCRQEVEAIRSRLDKLVDGFTLPGAVEKSLRWTGLMSIPLAAFLTVLLVGSEYGWGTLRTTLMKGPGRSRLLSVKLALVATALAVTWLVALVVIIASSLITTAAVSEVSHGDIDAAAVGLIIRDLGRVWFAALPFVALAALLSVLFSTWAGGTLAATGLSVGYFLVELFSVGRLITLFDGVAAFRWFGTFVEYDLGWNTAAWLFGRAGEPIPGFALAGAIGTSEYPGDVHAFLVQLGFLAVLGGLAFWFFRRRDVAGPSG